ncbi:MFP transporter [Archaeoglobales archaeon]|nr:MAG: MFP transporter [Archaeoglobales archaeon]
MFKQNLERSAVFVQKHPGLILILVGIVLLLSTLSSQNVKFEYGHGSMFPEDNVIYKQNELYAKDFGVGSENAFIFIKGTDILDRDVLEYMLRLSNNLKRINYVGEVVSPASIVVSVYGELPQDDAVLNRALEMYAKDMIPKKTFALMVVQITTTDSKKYKEIAEQIVRTIEFTPKPPDVIVQPTGGPVLSYQIQQAIKSSLGITTSASVVLMVIILFVVFSGVVRRKIMAFMPLVLSIFTVMIVYGLSPIIGIPMTEVTNAFMPVLIGLAIEYAAQLQNRFEEERREGKSVDEAVRIAIVSTGLAIALAMLTTVIGFLSSLLSGVPALGWFGILSALGLVIAFILTLTFLPSVLKLVDKNFDREAKVVEIKKDKESKEKSEIGVLERSLSFVSGMTATYPKIILVATAIILIVGGYAYTNVKLETNFRNYVPQDLPAIVLFKELERVVGGQYTYTIVLKTDEIDSSTIKKVDELGKYITQKEEYVDSYESLATLLKRSGGIPDDSRLDDVLSKIPEESKRKYISGNSWMALHLKAHTKDFVKQKELYNSLKRDLEFFGWKGGYYITGQTTLYIEIGNIIMSSQTTITLGAYVLVVLLLFGVYRSISKAVVPLLAITTVIAIVNIVMYSLGMKQTMVSVTMNSIILGLGIDFSIHVLERYFEERRRFMPIEAVRRTVERTGKAITTSALTMAGGFGALLLSPFPMMRDFGFLALVAILFSLFAALTVVPAFLMISERVRVRINLKENRIVVSSQ